MFVVVSAWYKIMKNYWAMWRTCGAKNNVSSRILLILLPTMLLDPNSLPGLDVGWNNSVRKA